MNPIFAAHVGRIPQLYSALIETELRPVVAHGYGNDPGIYIFYERGIPVHVGRTRKIRQRLRAHRTPSHNSASFAFKRARRELGRATTYSVATSRAALQMDEEFGPCFRRHVNAVAAMEVRFLPVADPIDQYFLELYTVLELGLPADEFDTH